MPRKVAVKKSTGTPTRSLTTKKLALKKTAEKKTAVTNASAKPTVAGKAFGAEAVLRKTAVKKSVAKKAVARMPTGKVPKLTAKAAVSSSAAAGRGSKEAPIAPYPIASTSDYDASRRVSKKKKIIASAPDQVAAPNARKVQRPAQAHITSLDGIALDEVRAFSTKAQRTSALRETKPTGKVVVRAGSKLPQENAQVQAMLSLNSNRISDLFIGDEPKTMLPPVTEFIGQIESSTIMKANDSALAVLQRIRPGLEVYPTVYAYPQFLHSLGSQLLASGEQMQPAPTDTKFTVAVQDQNNRPVEGITVSVLFSRAGQYMTGETGDDGIVELGIPQLYPKAGALFVEPFHTYWPQYLNGFERADAPKRVNVALAALGPDNFSLMARYAAYQPGAGLGVQVGVIDTGVGPHTDLDVKGGRCFVSGEKSDSYADNGVGHGTHVAGIIAAKKNNVTGSYGLAPACTLRSYRVCPLDGDRERCESQDIAAAIDGAIADGCHIINISLGSTQEMREVVDVLEKARNAGSVVFVSTGNDGVRILRYPAQYARAIAVAALGQFETYPATSMDVLRESDVRTGNEFIGNFSNYGPITSFVGLGVAVISTYPKDRYAIMSGTSMAAPFIAGLAARLLSQAPEVLAMKGSDRADAIFQLITQDVTVRRLGWGIDYGLFGILKG